MNTITHDKIKPNTTYKVRYSLGRGTKRGTARTDKNGKFDYVQTGYAARAYALWILPYKEVK